MITAVKIKDNLKFFFIIRFSFFSQLPIYTYHWLMISKELIILVKKFLILFKEMGKNFFNEISIVVGDEWFAGNLSYHLSSRPKWFNTIENNLEIVDYNTGVIYTGNPKILKKSCPGVFEQLNRLVIA